MTEQEKAIIRQMADYIELGSQGKQQITGRYKSEEGVCAMGACMLGAGLQATPEDALRLINTNNFPKITYPTDVKKSNWLWEDRDNRIDDVIISLNDVAGWDFVHIVAWMRSIAE